MTKTIQSTDLTAIDLQGYSGINGITVTATGGRYALSFDKGVTWKSLVEDALSYKSIIPEMSGPTGGFSASAVGFNAAVSVDGVYALFDSNPTNSVLWGTGGVGAMGYNPSITVYSNSPIRVCGYTIKPEYIDTGICSGITACSLLGSLDGANWVTLDTRTSITGWETRIKKTFHFSCNVSYNFYKLQITGCSYYVYLSQIELLGEKIDSWETILASEIQTKGMTLDILNTLKPNDFEPIFQRTQLDFLISLEAAESITGLTVFLPANQAPKATNITLNPATIHAGDAILSADLLDQEEQASDYRVLVDADIIRDWTPFGYSASISETININNLTMGSHVAHIQTRDSMAKQADYTVNFTRVNGIPTASVVWDSKHISAILGDPDNDKIKYQLTINGVIKIPWTDWVDAGFNFVYYFKRGELPVDQSSNLKIEYMDAVGATGVWTGVVAGTYFNLMFKDTLGNYYSNDYGTTLKILDLGTLIAGSATGYAEIMVKNETGFPVQNIQVYAENPYTGVSILLSYSDSPFVPVNPWVIPSVVADGDEVPLYIQCTADESAKHGGDFKLHIVGDLILPEIS